ncbi:MAG: two-component regulator propeller domain-containing protein [Chloroflexota bacterium]
MDERFDLRLRRGLNELIEAELGGYPRWAASPAAERVNALALGVATVASPTWWDRIGLRRRLGSRARLAWIAATVALLVLGLLAFAAVGGFDRRDEPSPSLPLAVELERSPALLAAGGFEILVGDRGDYGQAVADADGSTLWLLADGRLSRFDARRGTAESWTPAHDLAFTAPTIAPARGGGIWLIGSPPGGAGLRWFDGTAFRDVIDAPAQLVAAAEAPDGSVWVGTTDGAVMRWDGVTWASYDDRTPLPDSQISSMAVDSNGSVWIGWMRFPQPPGGGLVERLDGETWRTFDVEDAAPLGGTIWSISPLPDGMVWVASDAGVASFDGSAWRTFAPSPAGPRFAASVAAGPGGIIWTVGGDPDDGAVTVGRLDPAGGGSAEWTTYGPDDGLPGPNETGWITPRVLVAGDAVFVATGAGLLQLTGERWERIWPTVAPVDPGWPTALLPLSYDEAWAGTDTGLWRFRDGAWSQYTDIQTPTGAVGPVSDLEAAPDGSLWAAAASGTLRLQGNTWIVVDPRPAGRLAIGPDGTIWIGAPMETEGDKLWALQLDGTTWAPADVEDPAGVIADLAVGPDGRVWTIDVAWCLGQASVFDAGHWVPVDPGPDRVSAGWEVDVAATGDAWFVFCETENGGTNVVARLSGSDWAFYGEAEGFQSGSWEALGIGPDGAVWAATGSGLWKFDGASWTSHLPGVGFESVWVASDGSIWAVGPLGPIRFAPA